MATVKDVFNFIDAKVAPVRLKAGKDNVGFLAGFSDTEVKKIVVALDVTNEVIEEAAEKGAQLIVVHHPMIFDIRTATDEDYTGRKVTALLRNGLSAICMHTNLDTVEGGINDLLAKKVGIKEPQLLYDGGVDIDGKHYCIGRMGELEKEMTMAEYLPFVKNALNCNGLRYYDSGRPVKKVAVGGGSCGFLQKYVLENDCDTFVTGDVKYDDFLMARACGYNVIDADHFCTENVVVPYLAERLRAEFPDMDIIISERHCQTSQFM